MCNPASKKRAKAIVPGVRGRFRPLEACQSHPAPGEGSRFHMGVYLAGSSVRTPK
jgi:hypothetical protein